MFNHKQQKGEGNAKRKSNRYSILMLALIFIGFATYGTYAYFTDSTSVGSEIKLSTGTVSLGKVSKDDNWNYAPDTNYNPNARITKISGNEFRNAQPGDSFFITKEVEYTGTLNAKLNVKLNETLDNQMLSQGLKCEITAIKNSEESAINDFTVEPGDKVSINIKVIIDNSYAEEYYESTDSKNRNHELQSFDLSTLTEAVTLTVTQDNSK